MHYYASSRSANNVAAEQRLSAGRFRACSLLSHPPLHFPSPATASSPGSKHPMSGLQSITFRNRFNLLQHSGMRVIKRRLCGAEMTTRWRLFLDKGSLPRISFTSAAVIPPHRCLVVLFLGPGWGEGRYREGSAVIGKDSMGL